MIRIDYLKFTDEEHAAFDLVIERATAYMREHAPDLPFDATSTQMDLMACHQFAAPLDLVSLTQAPIGVLMHDLTGITRYLDREAGTLTGHFWPRCAARKAS